MQEGGSLDVATTLDSLGRVISIPIFMFLYGAAATVEEKRAIDSNRSGFILGTVTTRGQFDQGSGGQEC